VSEGLAHCLSLNLDPMKEILKHVFNITESNCCKPSDQPRDAARREECSDRDEKSLTTFCRCDGRAKGIAREHQNGFYET